MKRPNFWLRAFLALAIIVVIGEYAALTWLAPRYVVQAIQQAAGGELAVQFARLSFPMTTTLSGLRLLANTPEAALTIQKALIRPRGVSLASRRVWLQTVELDRPFLRLTRTKAGTFIGPKVQSMLAAEAPGAEPPASMARALLRGWDAHLETLQITEGVLEFVDENPANPFHGVLQHVFISLGPVALPRPTSQMSLAIRGEFIGHGGHEAPFYCSGWVDAARRNLEANCQFESLPLAAFEPYFQRSLTLRVYSATLKSTSQWIASANDLEARLQLELNDVSEGDLSIRGRTILDVKRLTNGRDDARLRAELVIQGPLDQPAQWHAQFIPGDEQVQHVIGRLLERGVEVIRMSFLGHWIAIGIAPASQAMMQDFETASKEIAEALEILATPAVPEPAPEPAAVPAVITLESPAAAPVIPEPPAPVGSQAPVVAPAPPAPPAEPSAPTVQPAPPQVPEQPAVGVPATEAP